MSLNYVTLVLDLYDGQGNQVISGSASFAPSVQLTDTADNQLIVQAPVPGVFHSSGFPQVKLLATDNAAVLPSGWAWAITFTGVPGNPAGFSFFLPYSGGATQQLSSLSPVSTAVTQFPQNPMTTLGDMIYGLAAGNPARVAGNTASAKQFLTQTGTGSVSAAPAWAALASADLPAIPAADLPAATTSTQGAVILDGTAADIQPIGVQAAGAKGQAADAKHVHPNQPWQFLPEAYGAKRDGKLLYDVTATNGSAVLTAAGLPAPAAPALSSGSGTVGSGTYQVEVTYVNQFGETLASTATSITVGASSSITVTSPLPWTNATGYYVYCTQAGGSSFTRQQAPGSATVLGANYVISAPPTNTGVAPPGSNTSNSAPFSAGDVGKHILIPSAGGFLNVALSTTIASYQSATQVTLAANATRSVTGAGAFYGTDDTAAIQAALTAAVAYAQAAGSEQAVCEVVFSAGMYCVAGTPGGTYQNAQIQIPYVTPYAGAKVNLQLRGPQESSGPVHWDQPNPPAAGATLVSTYYSDNGQSAPPVTVIGGPVTSLPGGLFSNMRVVVDGINVLAAFRPCISGLDLFGCVQADVKSFSYYCMASTAGAAGGWPPYITGDGNPSAWQVFGYRTPAGGNNAQNDLDRLTVYGAFYAVIFSDHFAAASVKAIYCFAAAVNASSEGANIQHHCVIMSLCAEACAIPVYCPVDGTYGGTPSTQAVYIPSLQVENFDHIIDDTSNTLQGEVRAESLGTTGLVTNGKNGAANIRLIWENQVLGPVASQPAIPASGTAFTNTYWRDAAVYIGATGPFRWAIDGTAVGSARGGLDGTVPVRIPTGHSITLAYPPSTVLSWAWVLE